MSALDGLRVELQRPSEAICCRGIAVIGSSTRIHAASLHCEDCGRHRGWLPRIAAAAIAETVERFGRPIEPITLKIPQANQPEEDTMATTAKQYDETNRGALFRNEKKETDRDPSSTGHLNVEGTDYWISAWLNTSKAGDKYMSLSVRRKDQPNDREGRSKAKPDRAAQDDAVFGVGS